MNTNGIHGKAMLVTLNISQWFARKIDKRAAAEVAANHKAESNKGSFYKSLVEGDSLEAIKQLATRARAAHYRRTLPWSDSGPRILSNLGYLDYMQEMAGYRQQFEKLVAQFVAEYPLLRQEAKRLLGGLFDDSDYPDLQSVVRKFSFVTNVTPLPMADDFRCDLGTEEVDRIRAEIQSNTDAAVKESVADAYDRVAKIVEAYIDRLANPDTTFRDSLVQNARDLAEVLPSLNFTGDPKLEEISKRLVDKLCVHEPDTLRHNKDTRRKAYEEAMEMHKDLIGFFGGTL